MLPSPARSAAASVRGFYLRSWRYSEDTELLVQQAIDREQWTTGEWKAWQEERLARVLHRAATRVPFYRAYWEGRCSRRGSWKTLANWPVLTKETLRNNPRAFVADDCKIKSMYCEHTSGTSGKPLELWQSRETLRSWYALYEARIRSWNGVDRYDRWAMMGGQLVTPFRQTRPPFWVWNAGLKQLYLSSYHLAERNASAYLEALSRHRIVYMIGYASSMFALAQMVLEKGLQAPKLKLAISNAERLFDHQRETISRAFGCDVRDTYGMAEFVAGGSECGFGMMHGWPEAGIVEVLHNQEDQHASDGETGRFICTGLLNADMPLIRYEVGDRGALHPKQGSCECGRNLPALKGIEGRLDDVVVTSDGRYVGRLDPVFKTGLHIREAQIVQESLDRIRVRLVPSPEYTSRDGIAVARRLRERVGDIEIVVESVDHIPRSANGKFRAVISNVARNSRSVEVR